MSTSLLYHGFGLHGYHYVRQKFGHGEIILRIRPKGEIYRCPVCKSWHIIRRGICVRRLGSVPVGSKPVWILEPFLKRIKQLKCKLLGMSTDLDPVYICAVIDNLPGVPLIFDHFHVVKLMNDALTSIRHDLYHELNDCMEKSVLKGTRWIPLKNPENLSEKHDKKERLKEALKLNEPLALAYYMKEELRQFWMQSIREDTAKLIESWTQKAWPSGIGKLHKMGDTIAFHKFGILNWYDHNISSGRVEETNNKIKVLKRMAYGYRDMEFFKLRIMAIHESKYALVG